MSVTENKGSATKDKSTPKPTAEPKAAESRSPEEIRKDIEGTREELGETVAAVAEKTDVKKQAQAKKEELKEQASAKAEEAKDKAKEIRDKAKDAAPDSAQQGVEQVQRVAADNPLPMAVAGGFLAGLIVGRLLSR
jgi:ElaB/YqjD/DUF883 family membrane-anchored ribosome-binding protein